MNDILGFPRHINTTLAKTGGCPQLLEAYFKVGSLLLAHQEQFLK